MKHQAIIQLVMAIATLPVSFDSGLAATISFDGGGINNDWSTAPNWFGDIEPTVGDRVNIADGHTVEISGANEVADGLTVNGASVLHIVSGDLTFGSGSLTLGKSSPGAVVQQDGLVSSVSGGNLIVEEFGEYLLSGGMVRIDGDLRVKGGTFELHGMPTLDVGGDVRFIGNAPAVLTLKLFGDTAPTMNAGGALHLNDRVALQVESVDWSGPTAVSVFNALGGIQGNFESVTVNGMPTTDYRFGTTGLVINVSEKSAFSRFMLGILTCLMVLPAIVR